MRTHRARFNTQRSLVAAWAMAMMLCVGCAPDASIVNVSVRSQRTGQPVAGAHVQLRPLHLFNAEPPHAILDSSPTAGSSGITDAQGAVQLFGVVDHPMDVRIVAPGYLPLQLTVVVDADPIGNPWLGSPSGGDDHDALEPMDVRIQP